MLLKCTQKLLRILDEADSSPKGESASESKLGDWYANSFSINHKQYVLFLSEKTHLSLVLTRTEARKYPDTFPSHLLNHLVWLGVPLDEAIPEINQYYYDIHLTKTDGPKNVQYLSSYIMYAKRIGLRVGVEDPVELTRRLAEFPTTKPIMLPDKDTVAAFIGT